MLRLLRRRGAVPDAVDLVQRLDSCRDRQAVYDLAIRALLVLIKDFAMDIDEIDSDIFRSGLDQFAQAFFEDDSPKRQQRTLERQTPPMAAYIESQKQYLSEREKEFRHIIDLLTRAMVSMDSENDSYHRKILQQGEKIDSISRLDDIRKIKSSLEKEVETLRQTVEAKQAEERQRLAQLSTQVDSLRQELEVVKEESLRDGLTGIYNRRAFDQRLQYLIERSLVQRTEFAILVLDIDNFKNVNDTFGHLVGDRVLLAIAQVCRQMIRSDDFLARYGGEEFVIVLPGASKRNAGKKAQLICKTIAKTRYQLGDAPDAALSLNVTVSIGLSVYNPGETSETLLARADQALYQAKAAGKNCAVAI